MHASSWFGLLLAAATACAPARVVMTPAPVPAAGSRIRYAVRSDTTRFTSGRLRSLDTEALVVERWDGTRWMASRVPADSIAQLQVRIGRRSNPGPGALIGGAIGAALGVVCAFGYDENDWFAPTPGQCLASGVVSGAAMGLLVGAISRSDVWAPVSLPPRRPGEPPAPPVTAAATSARVGE